MPNRIIKDSILSSERLADVSVQARWTFLGLVLCADDFGRMEANLRRLRLAIYPLDDMIGEHEFSRWIGDLHAADAIDRYEVDQKRFIQVKRWKNTPRAAESKFPPPPSRDGNLGKDASICTRARAAAPVTVTVTETVTETVTRARPGGSPVKSQPATSAGLAGTERGLREQRGDGGKPSRGARTAFALRCGGNLGSLADDRFVDQAFRHAVELEFVPDSDGGRQTVFAAAEETLRSGKTFGLFVKFVCEPEGRKGITNAADIGAEKRIRRFYRGEGGTNRQLSKVEEVFDEER